jgi:hypothetical protein
MRRRVDSSPSLRTFDVVLRASPNGSSRCTQWRSGPLSFLVIGALYTRPYSDVVGLDRPRKTCVSVPAYGGFDDVYAI